MTHSRALLSVFASLVLCSSPVFGQADAAAPQPAPQGKVLFSRGADSEASQPASPQLAQPDHEPIPAVTDSERGAVAIDSTVLDLHLIPASAALEVHVALRLRNSSSAPIGRVPLQLSSSLRWQTIAVSTPSGLRPVPFTQSPIATDADHTGYAQEAVLTLEQPLQPNASLTVTALYAGAIPQSASRLELLGMPADRAALVDWDGISAAFTGLRGFGNVLWYPCAAPTALLGDANRLFELIGRERLRHEAATLHLRLTIDYTGEGPSAAILDGRTEVLEKADDTQDMLVARTHGIATVDFGEHEIGFRNPSLFVLQETPTVAGGQLLAADTAIPETIEPLNAAAALVQPLLNDWLGPAPITPLTVIDHPGQPFEDGALLVTPLDANATAEALAPLILHGLAHAWNRSSHPWIDEGVAAFLNLLWVERTQGRPAVVAELQHDSTLIALAEPDVRAKPADESSSQTGPVGQPLTDASSEVYYRTKAAAVWWQLRGIVGDDSLKQALQAYRHSCALNPKFDDDPKAFERTLEKVIRRDLGWFFDDWVYRDRGLPDLTVLDVTPRPLPARPGMVDGYLIAVEVRNEGTAVAEVPVTVRSGKVSASERLRIPAGGIAATRIVFDGVPEQVQVNDGTVPELRTTVHTREITVKNGRE